jgi:phosphoglycerate dehydrogenase-like enzyme
MSRRMVMKKTAISTIGLIGAGHIRSQIARLAAAKD